MSRPKPARYRCWHAPASELLVPPMRRAKPGVGAGDDGHGVALVIEGAKPTRGRGRYRNRYRVHPKTLPGASGERESTPIAIATPTPMTGKTTWHQS